MLINSASHVIYDVHFEGITNSKAQSIAVEFFELMGHIYSVFAIENNVVVFKDYQQAGKLGYASAAKPLQMIFDNASNQLVLLASLGDKLQTYSIDVLNLVVKELQSIKVDDVISTHRTAKYFALKQAE